MSQRLKFIVIGLSAFCCLSVLTNCSCAVSEQDVQKMEAAMPAKPVAPPKQPRKLLVFNLCKGFKHGSIPYWDKALEIMGKKTGAFEVVVSGDMAMFKAENLNKFDAVCLNNTTKLGFEEPELRESLMKFIKGGKGIIGIHAATDNFYKWPEAAKMMGGQFCGHPWGSGDTVAIKIDDPEHPLMAPYKGKGFKVRDEIYRTKPPLYSRDKQRVLMSLDMSDEATHKKAGPKDTDIGISWVKSYGKGRLFYCSLGHNNHLTWNPVLLQHYLAGIQFALGDFPVDTKPKPMISIGKGTEMDELFEKIKKYDYGQSRWWKCCSPMEPRLVNSLSAGS
ncbi:MAG: ThuA domain-containing protein [Planctomycetota bacterium]